MLCGKCLQFRDEKDFLKGQEFCYQCIYKMKINNGKEEKIKYCRNCKKEMIRDEKTKKRQRNVYCSLECAEIGYKDQRLNHWTRKVQASPLGALQNDFGSCYGEI